MARADSYTVMPLDRWAEIVGINPVHFNGAYGTHLWPLDHPCQFVWPQYAWQTAEEYVNREYLAQVLSEAERQVATLVGYFHAPYFALERLAWHTLGQTYRTRYGYLQRIGRSRQQYLSSVPVFYYDYDEDGLDETGVAQCPLPSGVNYADIHVCFSGHDGDRNYEIRPANLTLVDNNVHITFARWQAIDPQLQNRIPHVDAPLQPINLDDPGSVVAQVDLYERTFSSDEIDVYHTPLCTDCSARTAAATRVYNGAIVDQRSGLFTLSRCQQPPVCQCGNPSSFTVAYEAGLLVPDPVLERAIALLALARLNNPPCTCSAVVSQYNRLRIDAADKRNQRFITLDQANSPLGTLLGEINAWNTISQLGMFQSWVGATA